MTEDLPDGAREMVEYYIEQEHGYLSWLGVTVEEFTKNAITLSVPYDEKLTNTTEPPTIHGGIAATLIDTAGGIAQRTMLDDPVEGGVATVNLNVNYLRRASGDLRATAEVIRSGGSIGWSRVTVESDTPDDGFTHEVATGQAAYRLFR